MSFERTDNAWAAPLAACVLGARLPRTPIRCRAPETSSIPRRCGPTWTAAIHRSSWATEPTTVLVVAADTGRATRPGVDRGPPRPDGQRGLRRRPGCGPQPSVRRYRHSDQRVPRPGDARPPAQPRCLTSQEHGRVPRIWQLRWGDGQTEVETARPQWGTHRRRREWRTSRQEAASQGSQEQQEESRLATRRSGATRE